MFTAEHEQFRQSVRRFVKNELVPHVEHWENAKAFPAHDVFPKMGALGMLGASYPSEYGGADADYLFHVIVADELGQCGCMGVPMATMVQSDIAVSGLAQYGSDELKAKFLAPAIAGEMVGALGVSEPDIGSDVASLSTRAKSDGDDYLISGSKMWITNGAQADFVVTLCRTSDEGGYKGMSLIVVPTDLPGFSVGRKIEKMGNHSSDTGLLSFDEVRVPKSYCVGQEGRGFYYQMEQFQKERLLGAMLGVSMGDYVVRLTIEYCRDRKVFGEPLLSKQWVYFHLAELRTELTIMRQFIYHCTERLMKGEDITLEISMAKLKTGRLVRQVTDTCVQFHGGMGYAEEYPMARMYRDARLLSIGAGADEVMMEIIAKLEGFGAELIQTLLIANRGEIAGRVISTCRSMGIGPIAVFSEADRDALYVRLADEAVFLGPAPASESYLNIEAVIQAAKKVGADAVHPGYGFLAENAEFARRVREAGLIFVGPTAEVIEQMGSKVAAREICREAGVPTVPGSKALDDDGLLAWADQHGYPVMLKAPAGGGGKGMRRLGSRSALENALASSRREAEKAFGTDELYLEKAVSQPRHLEVQIVGDEQGQLLHLGVREYSLQRRHQKLIEESPPANVSVELINGLTEAALKLAKAVNYTSLGTVEFLVDGEDFYFLEMNTRLQVEHPVTEIVTGTDPVQIQLQIAEGKSLGICQRDVMFRGHAIEARITCEDPYRGFLPATGTVLNWTPGPQVRFDTTLEVGAEVTPYYDSMVAKVIASAADRESALRFLQTALKSTVLLGVRHNIDFLGYLLSLPEVREGRQHTELVESLELSPIEPTKEQLIAAAATRWVALAGHQQAVSSLEFRFAFEGHPEVTVGHGCFRIDGKSHKVRISANALEVDGHRYKVASTCRDGCWWVHTPDGTDCFVEIPRLPVPGKVSGPGSLTAPMPGSVVEVLVKEGQTVEQGQALLKLEAMKMEQVIASPADGTIEKIHFGPGEQVEAGVRLITLNSDEK